MQLKKILANVSFTVLSFSVVGCTLVSSYESGEDFKSKGFTTTLLPFKSGTSFKVRQGAFGRSSHNEPGNEYAWDLEVPLNTPVTAVEGGTVLYVFRPPDAKGDCDSQAYRDSAWNVLIEHGDGTVAQYTHVDSEVKAGDRVWPLEVIGHTAWKGWICYPHLHFSVYQSRNHLYNSLQRRTLPVRFRGIPDGILREGQTYFVPR